MNEKRSTPVILLISYRLLGSDDCYLAFVALSLKYVCGFLMSYGVQEVRGMSSEVV